MDRFPGAVFASVAEVGVHRLPGGKVTQQVSPFAALRDHVKDGVQHRPQAGTAGATAGFGRRQQRLN